MKRSVLVAVMALGMSAAVWISPAKAQEQAIQGVIGAQLEAFLADDFATAFTYASPAIKGMFGTADNFGSMVKQGYPMVWRPADVQYRALEMRNGGPVQRVLITDQNGARYALDYYMLKTDMGWQINGVDLVPLPEVGV